MNTDNEIMNQVKLYAKKFVEKEYPREVPYFDIAWETYRKAFHNTCSGSDRMLRVTDLRKPIVRDLEKSTTRMGGSMIMAPRVIRAFHILFSMNQRLESEYNETSRQEMLQYLSQEFSHEFSLKIVNFFVENTAKERS